jgi:hypothetical protein
VEGCLYNAHVVDVQVQGLVDPEARAQVCQAGYVGYGGGEVLVLFALA